MPITIVCSQCEKKLKAPDTAAGKKIRCPACKAVIAVPAPEKPAPTDDDLVEPDEDTGVTDKPEAVKKTTSKVKTDADEETAVTDRPDKTKKKKAWEDEDDRDDDDRDDDDDDRPRKKKKRRRADDDFGGRRPRRDEEPHRGVLILILGILSIFLSCCPLIAWIVGGIAVNMANEDFTKMDSRAMDPSGQGLTTAGKICGIVGVALGVINAIAGIILNVMDVLVFG